MEQPVLGHCCTAAVPAFLSTVRWTAAVDACHPGGSCRSRRSPGRAQEAAPGVGDIGSAGSIGPRRAVVHMGQLRTAGSVKSGRAGGLVGEEVRRLAGLPQRARLRLGAEDLRQHAGMGTCSHAAGLRDRPAIPASRAERCDRSPDLEGDCHLACSRVDAAAGFPDLRTAARHAAGGCRQPGWHREYPSGPGDQPGRVAGYSDCLLPGWRRPVG